jgi:hypothetical protein
MEELDPADGLDDAVIDWDCEVGKATIVRNEAVWRGKVLGGVGCDAVAEEVSVFLEISESGLIPSLPGRDGVDQSQRNVPKGSLVQVWLAVEEIAGAPGRERGRFGIAEDWR